MVKTIPYLLVPNGKQVIEWYKKVFGAKVINHMPFSKDVGKEFGLPEDFDYDNSTMHAELEIGGALIYMADHLLGPPFTAPGNVEVLLSLESKEQLEKFYNLARKEGATVKMELQQTFWGATFARIEDPFHIGWQFNAQGPPQDSTS